MAMSLTNEEHDALTKTKDLANLLVKLNLDWHEVIVHLHCIQNAILANSAAREYPDLYRLGGER